RWWFRARYVHERIGRRAGPRIVMFGQHEDSQLGGRPLIVEDNPYGMFAYDHTRLPTLKALDRRQQVLHRNVFENPLSRGANRLYGRGSIHDRHRRAAGPDAVARQVRHDAEYFARDAGARRERTRSSQWLNRGDRRA